MIEAWTQWEGHVVNDEFLLQKYLGGSSQSGVFLTERRGRALKQATIKFIPASEANNTLYPSRWSAAERLSHPHLTRLLEQGRCQLGSADLLFVVMEYAEENLAEILSERALTPAEARDLLEPMLQALSYLHNRGFVHNRLKPANVLAARDEIKLASDGVCAPGETASVPAGLNAYDPPEKASGASLPAGDIWSLGMTLAEALTQRTPSWSEKEQADPVVPENLPAPLLDIVRGCLRRDSRSRLTIADITARLRPAPSLPPPQRQRESPQTRAVIPPKYEPFKPLIAPAIIAVLTVVALFGGLGVFRQPDARQNATPARPAVKPQAKLAEHPPQTADQQASQSGTHPVLGSNSKPSPIPGRGEAPASTDNSGTQTSVATIQHPSENRDVIREVVPDVPRRALDTIQGTIRVGIRVQVDSAGNVVETEVESPGPSRYFARLATQAAEGWKFAPSDQLLERQFNLRFDFTNTEARAFATRAP
jgi:serine/threonine-protein kinase